LSRRDKGGERVRTLSPKHKLGDISAHIFLKGIYQGWYRLSPAEGA
jgi:hypothetical protein